MIFEGDFCTRLSKLVYSPKLFFLPPSTLKKSAADFRKFTKIIFHFSVPLLTLSFELAFDHFWLVFFAHYHWDPTKQESEIGLLVDLELKEGFKMVI